MLTKVSIRAFKSLDDVTIELGQNVVLIGPNNSGKTTTLQALTLWQAGLKEWLARRTNGSKADTRTGVTLNRRNLTHTPVGDARHLWRALRVMSNNTKIFLDVTVSGESQGETWQCGLEFYYANAESLYCRPIRLDDSDNPLRMTVPEAAGRVRLAMLPPMSGLAAEEPELQPGRISVLVGEGRTAEVLRNLCLQVHRSTPDGWKSISERIEHLFGVHLADPVRDPVRGTVALSYTQHGTSLDLSSAGRGLQQTLLLLAHLHANPQSVLLLDEPDAHLEILRQRQVYTLLTETAEATGSQIIAASHSEVILNEAADKHVVVAFVGVPHRIDDRGSQVVKSLKEIGFEHYYQAEQKGFVLYLEGSTDLAILRRFAEILGHPAADVLEAPYVHYVQNQPKQVEHHFYGLKEAKKDLVGFAIFDRLDRGVPQSMQIPVHTWRRREIENYIASPAVLMRYAAGMEPEDLITLALRNRRAEAMREAMAQVESNLKGLDKDPWSHDFKVSDEFLPILFRRYFEKLGTDNRLDKSDFHVLATHMTVDDIDAEVSEVLDNLLAAARQAKPAR